MSRFDASLSLLFIPSLMLLGLEKLSLASHFANEIYTLEEIGEGGLFQLDLTDNSLESKMCSNYGDTVGVGILTVTR